MEGDALKTFQNDLLYSNKKVSLPTVRAPQKHYTTQNTDTANRTDNNLDVRLDKFSDQIQDEYYYMIPLRFLCDLGLVNQPVNCNTKWLITFEQDYQKLFETKANQAKDALPTSVDVKIILTATPYFLFEQFKLDDNYHAYLKGIMISNEVLRTGIKKTSYQKTYELIVGAQSRTITLELSNKQISFLESLLVFDSSHHHKSIYDSYNAEDAITIVSSIRLENVSDTYSEFNTVKFDLTDDHDKHIMYNAFIAWICNGSTIAPLSDYAHNPIYQEAPRKNKYFTDSDERRYIDLRTRSKGHSGEFERVNHNDSDLTITIELKTALTKKNEIKSYRLLSG